MDEAAASFRSAVQIQPNSVAYRHLGLALMGVGRFVDAAGNYHLALGVDPDDAVTHIELARAQGELGQYKAAEASFKRALELAPDSSDNEARAADVLLMMGRVAEARVHVRRALTIEPNNKTALQISLFIGLYESGTDAMALTVAARRYARAIASGTTRIVTHGNVPNPERRLKLGLVSGDLCEHSVGRFLETVLAAIDVEKLELFAYATSVKSDAVTARLKQSVSNWRKAVNLNDDALIAAILADQIDILVDLSGHTNHNRLPAFVRKPAPVEVTWLGYSATTGLDAIDYILADRIVIPPEEENQFAETPWRLPDSYLCFSPPHTSVEVAPLPALAKGLVTFGSFNNVSKLSDRTIACWARVLHAVPGSRLRLKAQGLDMPATVESFKERFAAHDIDAQRLDLRGYEMMVADHLSSYDEVDIGLDPFPYAGTTTTAEAFWMGVPVLTLKGDRFIAHVGETMLHSVGLDDWIATDEDDYVARAAGFAADLQVLGALRRGLRARLIASPLCDAPRFARNLEAAFRGMWRIWCEKQG